MGELESDAGGPDVLTHARRSLIRRAALIEVLIEGQELGLALGQSIDAGSLTQALNSLLGVYRLTAIFRDQPAERSEAELQAMHTLGMAELTRAWGDEAAVPAPRRRQRSSGRALNPPGPGIARCRGLSGL